jgi:hypothetical protein
MYKGIVFRGCFSQSSTDCKSPVLVIPCQIVNIVVARSICEKQIFISDTSYIHNETAMFLHVLYVLYPPGESGMLSAAT